MEQTQLEFIERSGQRKIEILESKECRIRYELRRERAVQEMCEEIRRNQPHMYKKSKIEQLEISFG